MGTGKLYSLHETDETRQSGAEEAFEEILRKVKAAGGEITEDETFPLYTEIGAKEAEVGKERVIEFSLKRIDFQMIRKIENQRITGVGHNKGLEPMVPPKVKTVLKKKEYLSLDWEIVDLEDMF